MNEETSKRADVFDIHLWAVWLTGHALGLSSGVGGLVATIAARIENVQTKLPAPNRRGFFRPTRSRMNTMKLQKYNWLFGENVRRTYLQEVGDRSNGSIDTLYEEFVISGNTQTFVHSWAKVIDDCTRSKAWVQDAQDALHGHKRTIDTRELPEYLYATSNQSSPSHRRRGEQIFDIPAPYKHFGFDGVIHFWVFLVSLLLQFRGFCAIELVHYFARLIIPANF